ncbi:hypothetical protein HA402_000339 [Bradysia odoriphaga]|nr:hypothetical protein HA402_000339 [Bradysia odoriphaga]
MHLVICLTILCGTYVSAGILTVQQPKQLTGLWNTLDKQQPILVAHRGEKVLMPEHTVGSYEFAAIEGADYVEPDLVLTQDGHLVCFHDLSLRSGTNVADLPQFADKRGNLTIEIGGGFNQTINNDWFIHNFTLAELKQLRVKQLVRGIRPQYFNTLFEIPTFSEYLNVIHKMSYLQNKSIGVIPELKDPAFHNGLWPGNYYMENLLLNTLTDYGHPIRQGDVPKCNYTNNGNNFDITCGHVIIQSFDMDCIKYLHQSLGNGAPVDLLKLVSIQNYQELTYDGLKEVAGVAQHIHIGKEYLYTGIEVALQNYNYDKERIANLGGFVPPGDIVKECHALNLRVGIYTIVDSHENSNRGCAIQCEPNDKEKELFYYFEMGVDGFFVENVPETVIIRMKFDHQLQIEALTSSGSRFVGFGGFVILVVNFIRMLH